MGIESILGVVGGIASIVALFLPAQNYRSRIIHAIYVLAIAVLTGYLVYSRSQLRYTRNIAKGATALLSQERMMADDEFILAALSFLEHYRYEFPDSYKRAQDICSTNQTFSSENKLPDGVSGLHHAWSKIDVASYMRGIVKGIAATAQGGEHVR